MTPKEKAEKLVDKYLTASFRAMEEYIPVPMVLAKQCALIAVDEVLNEENDFIQTDTHFLYWEQVKQEIKNLYNQREMKPKSQTGLSFDAYKNYKSTNPDVLADDEMLKTENNTYKFFTEEEFINKIKTDNEFAKKWGDIYYNETFNTNEK